MGYRHERGLSRNLATWLHKTTVLVEKGLNAVTKFTISKAAVEEIQRIYQRSKCHDPVVRFREFADAQGLFDDIAQDALRSASKEEDLKARATNRFAEVQDQLKPMLMVEARERARYKSEDLFEVDGITITMSAAARQILDGHILVFEDGRFFLRDTNGSAYTLSDLVRRSKD
jgi:hypothetical protein